MNKEKYQEDKLVITMDKTLALAMAHTYGLEWEVETMATDLIKNKGKTESEAYMEALVEWDII